MEYYWHYGGSALCQSLTSQWLPEFQLACHVMLPSSIYKKLQQCCLFRHTLEECVAVHFTAKVLSVHAVGLLFKCGRFVAEIL